MSECQSKIYVSGKRLAYSISDERHPERVPQCAHSSGFQYTSLTIISVSMVYGEEELGLKLDIIAVECLSVMG